VKGSDTKATDELVADEMVDPAFRAEWGRTALARAVAIRLVRYRAERELSQRDLAKLLEMNQPQIARLERGDVNPTIETLMRLAGALMVEFCIDVRPVAGKSLLLTKRAQDSALTYSETDRAAASVAVT